MRIRLYPVTGALDAALRERPSSPRWPLVLLAILYAVTTTVYIGIWIRHVRILPQSTMGVAFRPFSPERKELYLVHERLIATLAECRDRPAEEILVTVIRLVHEFGGEDQADDLTLIVARVV